VVEIDARGLEVLSRQECLRLLGTATLGRMVVNVDGLPVVVPVGFLITLDGIVVRIPRGSALEAATQDAVAAFQVDAIDPDDGSGWTVLVQGIAAHVEECDPLEPPPGLWSGGPDDRSARISFGLVSGQRSSPAPIGRSSAGLDRAQAW
jgi:hypothetical protein